MEWVRRQPRSQAAVNPPWCGGRSAFPWGLVSLGRGGVPVSFGQQWQLWRVPMLEKEREVGVDRVDIKLRLLLNQRYTRDRGGLLPAQI